LARYVHVTLRNPEIDTGKQVRRKYHGKETLEEGKEAGSDQAVDAPDRPLRAPREERLRRRKARDF